MNLKNRLTRILCGTGLALTFAVVPAMWAQPSASAAPQSRNTAAMRSSMRSSIAPVDINTASADQLKALPGIGDTYAKRIIQNRPYSSKDQLTTKGVLPRSVYDKIKANIVAHRMMK